MAERAKARGKKGGKKKEQAAPVAGQGHNSGSIPDEVIDRNMRLIEIKANALAKAREAQRQANGEYRSTLKAAKKDGMNTDAIIIARKLHKMDHGTVVTDFADVGRYLKIIQSPLATQALLFQSLPEYPANPAFAGTQAYRSNNARETNPYPPGSERYVEFDNAWLAAQSATAEEMAPDRTVN